MHDLVVIRSVVVSEGDKRLANIMILFGVSVLLLTLFGPWIARRAGFRLPNVAHRIAAKVRDFANDPDVRAAIPLVLMLAGSGVFIWAADHFLPPWFHQAVAFTAGWWEATIWPVLGPVLRWGRTVWWIIWHVLSTPPAENVDAIAKWLGLWVTVFASAGGAIQKACRPRSTSANPIESASPDEAH